MEKDAKENGNLGEKMESKFDRGNSLSLFTVQNFRGIS